MTEALPLLPIDQIYVDPAKYPLPFDAENARALGRQIAAEGQLAAITVRRRANAEKGRKEQPFELIDGRRRLEGMRDIGRTEIATVIVECAAGDVRRLNVAANLDRKLLSVIELAILIGERSRSRPIIGRTERSATFAQGEDWGTAQGALVGCSRSTIYNHLALSTAIVEPFPDLVPAICGHPLGDNFTLLTKIAQEDVLAIRRDRLVSALEDREAPPLTNDGTKREYSKGFDYKWSKSSTEEQRKLARSVARGTRQSSFADVLAEFLLSEAERRSEKGWSEALAHLPDRGVDLVRRAISGFSDRDREAAIAEFRFYDRQR